VVATTPAVVATPQPVVATTPAAVATPQPVVATTPTAGSTTKPTTGGNPFSSTQPQNNPYDPNTTKYNHKVDQVQRDLSNLKNTANIASNNIRIQNLQIRPFQTEVDNIIKLFNKDTPNDIVKTKEYIDEAIKQNDSDLNENTALVTSIQKLYDDLQTKRRNNLAEAYNIAIGVNVDSYRIKIIPVKKVDNAIIIQSRIIHVKFSALRTIYSFSDKVNNNILELIKVLYSKLYIDDANSTKTDAEKVYHILQYSKKILNWDINKVHVEFFLKQIYKADITILDDSANAKSLFDGYIRKLKNNSINSSSELISVCDRLIKIGFQPDNEKISIFQCIDKFNALSIDLRYYVRITETYIMFGLQKKSDLLNFLDYCYKFNIKETTNAITLNEFKKIIGREISYNNFFKFIDVCMTNPPFYNPDNKNSRDFKLFIDSVKKFKKSKSNNSIFNPLTPTSNIPRSNNPFFNPPLPTNIITEIEFFKTSIKNVGINDFVTYNNMIIQMQSYVKVITMDMSTFISKFTAYYNTRKYPQSSNDEKQRFEKTYPALKNRIGVNTPPDNQSDYPTISFDTALISYLSIFDQTLKFSQFLDKNYCFGVFINDMLSVSKRYMIQYADKVYPEQLPIPYESVSYFEGEESFTVQKTNRYSQSTNTTTTTQDPISGLIYLYNSFVDYLTNITTISGTREGYLQSISSIGVKDTTEDITVSNSDGNLIKIKGEKELFDYINRRIGVTSFNEMQRVIKFFSSLHITINQIDSVLNDMVKFKVEPSNFRLFIDTITDFKVGDVVLFQTLLRNLSEFGVSMQNIIDFNTQLRIIHNPNIKNSGKIINDLLEILLKYKITYTTSVYDKCNTKFSNFVFNLSADGITVEKFLSINPTFMSALNTESEHSENELNTQVSSIYDLKMRDLIIKRTEFFINPDDITPYGSKACDPNYALNWYDTHFNINSKWNNEAYDKMLMVTYNTDNNKQAVSGCNDPLLCKAKNYYQAKLSEKYETLGNPETGNEAKFELYKNITQNITFSSNLENNLTSETYTWLINYLDNKQFSDLKADKILGDDKLSRQFMSLLLANILNDLDTKLQGTFANASLSTEGRKGNIQKYNIYTYPVNMVLLFPHYTLYLLTKYAKSGKYDRESNSSTIVTNLAIGVPLLYESSNIDNFVTVEDNIESKYNLGSNTTSYTSSTASSPLVIYGYSKYGDSNTLRQ
jgi:molecular chaperone GrpE (heat shock protein)